MLAARKVLDWVLWTDTGRLYSGEALGVLADQVAPAPSRLPRVVCARRVGYGGRLLYQSCCGADVLRVLTAAASGTPPTWPPLSRKCVMIDGGGGGRVVAAAGGGAGARLSAAARGHAAKAFDPAQELPRQAYRVADLQGPPLPGRHHAPGGALHALCLAAGWVITRASCLCCCCLCCRRRLLVCELMELRRAACGVRRAAAVGRRRPRRAHRGRGLCGVSDPARRLYQGHVAREPHCGAPGHAGPGPGAALVRCRRLALLPAGDGSPPALPSLRRLRA